MEAAPPSYENATLTDHWDMTARYLPSSDLCSAALVCSRWHTTFIPHLWGNPASHFGIENDAVYVALTRFKRTLKTTRFFVRSLTHTLHLPPAHAELYNGPHADWLREILERLPNLQSLIVRGLPFFDHAALQALRYLKKDVDAPQHVVPGAIELPGSNGPTFQRNLASVPSFGLRLLDASRCPNITSHGLALALRQFENLMYLDLSFTHPARDLAVIESFKTFTGLHVLKMRGLNLRDDSIECLSKSIGLRVRSLDIRDNMVSDHGIRSLLDHCFITVQSDAPRHGQRSPSLLPYLGSEMLAIYQGEEFEGFLRNAFTGRFISRLAIEDVPDGGITHLYIAGNEVSVEGVSGLLRSQRLHVLDVGNVKRRMAVPRSPDGSKPQRLEGIPGVEKLTPVFSKHASQSLTFLRIDHSLITKDTPTSLRDEIVPGRVELGNTSIPHRPSLIELSGRSIRPEAFEVAAGPSTPRYELEGDQMQFRVNHEYDDAEAEMQTRPRRGSVFAPEAVPSSTNGAGSDTLLSPLSEPEGTIESNLSPGVSDTNSRGEPLLSPSREMPRNYTSIDVERKARLNAHMAKRHSLHPAMIPHVAVLVLTGIPAATMERSVGDRLVLFIKQCAEEASFAHTQASSDYALPPGRKGHATAVKDSERKIFALQRLVLELAPEQDSSQQRSASFWRHQETKSMTGDRDSEALWAASEADFSFFGDEECGLPSLESGQSFYSSPTEKEVHVVDSPVHDPKNGSPLTPGQVKFDVVSLISAFRRDRRSAHERNIFAGNPEPQTEGFWTGAVQVVRSAGDVRSDEETDYYGNKFTTDGYYR